MAAQPKGEPLADAHRHRWSVAGFGLDVGRPVMQQSCAACGLERTIPAWDRTWIPPPRWRLVPSGHAAVAGRLLAPVLALGRLDRMTGSIRVDVWSDVACPWCYIGKRNLEAGIAAYRAADAGRPPVEVEYHSFELAPDTPVDFEGSELDYLARVKGIGVDEARRLLDRVSGIAAGVGLHYDFASVKHTRTVKAHQVLHFANARGLQRETAERLFSAYFVEGRHLGRDEELAELAGEVGLDGADVLRSLRADEHLADVRADQQQAIGYGIRGVPFFVIDAAYGLSGAQPPETFAAALAQVAAERVAIPERAS